MTLPRFTATVLRMSSPVMIWAAHFLVIYGFTALACARGFVDVRWIGIGIVPWTIGAATALALAATLAVVLRAARAAHESFTEWMTAALGALSMLAMFWEALPVLMVPACA